MPATRVQNRLLARLPAADAGRWWHGVQWIDLAAGTVLHGPGVASEHVYFPATAIVSLQHLMANGDAAEVAVVGNEGVVGVADFMGGSAPVSQAVVLSAGTCYRVDTSLLRAEFERGGALVSLLLRHTQALITQMSQTAVCNRHHALPQQLCRWLLISFDRLADAELAMTQQRAANMLGVRRAGVAVATARLQSDGVIECRRGHIALLDRARLEARACECYAVVKKETDRLLPPLPVEPAA